MSVAEQMPFVIAPSSEPRTIEEPSVAATVCLHGADARTAVTVTHVEMFQDGRVQHRLHIAGRENGQVVEQHLWDIVGVRDHIQMRKGLHVADDDRRVIVLEREGRHNGVPFKEIGKLTVWASHWQVETQQLHNHYDKSPYLTLPQELGRSVIELVTPSNH